MENASKALIMAAGVLIGVLILSLAVYLFATFGAASAEVHEQNAENQISQFNVQFTSYEGRTDITIHDIVTVANLAKNTNDSYDLTEQTDNNYYIIVNAKTTKGTVNNLQNYTSTQLDELVSYELDNLVQSTDENGTTYPSLPTYTCDVTINSTTGRVSLVVFNLNS